MSRMGSGKPDAGYLEPVGEALHWRFAALLLQRPRSGWQNETGSLYGEISLPRLKALAVDARDITEGAYLRVFGPGGLVSPREVAYRPNEDPGKIIADISFIYSAFTFTSRAEDPLDHISVEANFAGFLALKEAYAVSEGNTEAFETITRGFQKFLLDHLEPFARALSQRLKATEPSYLGEATDCLLDLMQKRISVSDRTQSHP